MPNNIKKIREQKHISQTDLAKLLKISRTHLSRIENGEVNLSIRLAVRIARILESSLDDIFFN